MIINLPGPVQNLNTPYRLTAEAEPIKVLPYMITERDLAAIGHAKCQFCSTPLFGAPVVPRWLVSGWSACDRHLADIVRAAADFNRRHLIWDHRPAAPVDLVKHH